ncbi:unnamed protein product, partial [Symbiodinium sp. KB8]
MAGGKRGVSLLDVASAAASPHLLPLVLSFMVIDTAAELPSCEYKEEQCEWTPFADTVFQTVFAIQCYVYAVAVLAEVWRRGQWKGWMVLRRLSVLNQLLYTVLAMGI